MDVYSCRDGEEVLKEEEQSHFRKLVGIINWLSMNTRPDLCFDAIEMACNFGKAKIKDIKRAGRILRKAKDRGMELQFSNLGNAKEAVLMVCVNRSYGKLNKVDSCGGKFIVLVGEGGNKCPISMSKTSKIRSSTRGSSGSRCHGGGRGYQTTIWHG